MLVQFIALGKLIYVFGTPYGDEVHDSIPTDRDEQERPSA